MPLSHPLAQETVMTLNPGMARWLQFEIARQTGVAFGWDFALPGKLFNRVFAGFAPDFDVKGNVQETVTRWHLLQHLANLDSADPRFHLVRAYCREGSPTRRFRLASRLARLFDEYLIYRPAQIIDWEDNPKTDDDWQAELWRRLIRSLFPHERRPLHIARLWNRLRTTPPSRLTAEPGSWPERVCLFGVSSLAPLYLDFLDAFSHFRPVHIFLLQPSDMYWADLKSNRQIARIASRSRSEPDQLQLDFAPPATDDWVFDTGNPLLPALGKQGQSFLDLALDHDPIQDDEAFAPPIPDTQLHTLQSDLFTLADRGDPNAFSTPDDPFPEYDGSIQLHICSSKRREIEVLWDYLVDRFNQDNAPRPNQVLVMAPEIQTYAPHIDAVFARRNSSEFHIPYSIADRLDLQQSPVIAGVCSLLETATSRASATELSQVLELPLVREAFAFTELDLQHIEFWIRELGITWGWHADHRRQQGGFPTDRNTWRELEARLAAGIAFGSEDPSISTSFLPFGEIESDLVDTAGRFIEFIQLMNELYQWQSETRPLAAWQPRFLHFLARLNTENDLWLTDFQRVATALREALPSLPVLSATGAEATRSALDKLQQSAPSSGYLSGGVTFCSLKPMRSIPADTICLIGMNHSDFPRRPQRLSFDLLEQSRQRGDRNPRDEDRQFFLETLLSVRSHLYISHLGLSPTNDNLQEPSSVVTELLAYLKRCVPESEFTRFTLQHKRQSYDAAYFADDRLFTYDQSRAALRNRFDHPELSILTHTQPDKTTPPCPNTREGEPIDLETLIAFCRDPAKHYAEEILQTRFGQPVDDLQNLDTFFQDGLDRYQLREAIAADILANKQIQPNTTQRLASEKRLPPGGLAQIAFAEVIERAAPIAAFYQSWIQAEPPIRHRLNLRLGNYTLRGALQARPSTEQLFLNPSDLKVSRLITYWIHHLAANALALQNDLPPQPTTVISLHPDQNPIALQPQPDAPTQLETVINQWIRGCSQALPLFPELSYQVAYNMILARKPLPATDALKKAQASLAMAQNGSGNFATIPWTPYDALCFGPNYCLPSDFAETATTFWQPIFQATKEVELSI